MSDRPTDLAALLTVIRARRERLGWSVHRLAVRAGVSDPYVRRIDAGQADDIGFKVLSRIALALGTSPVELLEEAAETREGGRVGLGDEMAALYARLGNVERRAWLRMGTILQEMQAEYQALLLREQPVDMEPVLPEVPVPIGARRKPRYGQEDIDLADWPEEEMQAQEIAAYHDPGYADADLQRERDEAARRAAKLNDDR